MHGVTFGWFPHPNFGFAVRRLATTVLNSEERPLDSTDMIILVAVPVGSMVNFPLAFAFIRSAAAKNQSQCCRIENSLKFGRESRPSESVHSRRRSVCSTFLAATNNGIPPFEGYSLRDNLLPFPSASPYRYGSGMPWATAL